MKKYTILQNAFTDEIIVVETSDIYEVAYLSSDNDFYIWNKEREELSSCEGYYPLDYFANNEDEMLVMPVEDASAHKIDIGNCEALTVMDFTEEELNVYDLTKMGLTATAKAVHIEHGIKTDRIIFDANDGESEYCTMHEVDAEIRNECEADYPRQAATRLYICDNGLLIRETHSFFADESRDAYEIIDESVDYKYRKLEAPESIHTLSEMGEALNTHEDYPWDWVEDVCNQNDWLNIDSIGGKWDEDICTNGREILYFGYDHNNVFVTDTRDVEEEDLDYWEQKILSSYPEYSSELDKIRAWREEFSK